MRTLPQNDKNPPPKKVRTAPGWERTLRLTRPRRALRPLMAGHALRIAILERGLSQSAAFRQTRQHDKAPGAPCCTVRGVCPRAKLDSGAPGFAGRGVVGALSPLKLRRPADWDNPRSEDAVSPRRLANRTTPACAVNGIPLHASRSQAGSRLPKAGEPLHLLDLSAPKAPINGPKREEKPS